MKLTLLIIICHVAACIAFTCSWSNSCPSAEFCSIHCRQIGRAGGQCKMNSLEGRCICYCYKFKHNRSLKLENSNKLDLIITNIKTQCSDVCKWHDDINVILDSSHCMDCIDLNDCMVLFNSTIC